MDGICRKSPFSPFHDDPHQSEHEGEARQGRQTASTRESKATTAIAVLLLFLTAFQAWFLWRTSLGSAEPTDLLGEPNRLVPNFKGHMVRFPERENGTEQAGGKPENILNNTLATWMTTLPLGGGFIVIDEDRSDVQLPPPIHVDGKLAYSIAVFHQLHCLHTLLTQFDLILRTRPSYEEYGLERTVHADHCFEYVKRSLMCCSDSALEGQKPGDARPATDGTGSYHLCRNYEALKTWTENSRVNDMNGLHQSVQK